MRAMRVSGYVGLHEPPITIVMPEDALVDTLESIRAGSSADLTQMLIVTDIFEVGDDTSAEAITFQGMKRWTPEVRETERLMSVLFHWMVVQWSRVGSNGTVVAGPKITPLSSANVRLVFEQLSHHPDYGERNLMAVAEDMTPVIMKAGVITEHPKLKPTEE